MSGTVMLNEMINNYKARIAELEAENEKLKQQLDGLIMQVQCKFPDETRYETAKRYIFQRENLESVASEAWQEIPDKDGVPK